MDLSWVQTFCKSYQLSTLVGKGLDLSFMLYYQEELEGENRNLLNVVSLKDRKLAEQERTIAELERTKAELERTKAEQESRTGKNNIKVGENNRREEDKNSRGEEIR